MNTAYPYAFTPTSPFTPGYINQYPWSTPFNATNPYAQWNNQWNNWNTAYTPIAGYPFSWNNTSNTPWGTTPWNFNQNDINNPGYTPNANWNTTPWGNWGYSPIAHIAHIAPWSNFNPWFYAAQFGAPGAFNAFPNSPVSAFPFPGAYHGSTGYNTPFNHSNAGIPGAYPFNAAFYGTNSPNRVNGNPGIPGFNGTQQPVREAA